VTSFKNAVFARKEMPEFILPLLWPPNSPVHKTYMTDLDKLKYHTRAEWAKLDHAVIAASVHQWRRRLSGCVKAGGAVVISSTLFDLDLSYCC